MEHLRKAQLTTPQELIEEITATPLYKSEIYHEPAADADERLMRIYEFLLNDLLVEENNRQN